MLPAVLIVLIVFIVLILLIVLIMLVVLIVVKLYGGCFMLPVSVNTIRRGALCRLLVLIVLTVLIVAKRYRTLPKTRINAIPGTVLYGGILLAHPANND